MCVSEPTQSRRRVRLVVSSTVIALLLAACAGESTSENEGAEASSSPAASDPTPSVESTDEPAQTQVEGTADSTPTPSPSETTYPYLAADEIPLERILWLERPKKSIDDFVPFDEDQWGRCNVLQAIDRIFNAAPASTKRPGYPRFINRAESIDGVDYISGNENTSELSEVQIREIGFTGPKRARAFLDRIREADGACSRLDISVPEYLADYASIEDEHIVRFSVTDGLSRDDDSVSWRVKESWFYKNDNEIIDDSIAVFGTAVLNGSSVFMVRVYGKNDGLTAKEAAPTVSLVLDNYSSAAGG